MQTKTLLAAFREQVERIETNWEARFNAELREHQERIETNWEARFNAERRERQERIETNWEARFNAERRERQEEMSALARSLASGSLPCCHPAPSPQSERAGSILCAERTTANKRKGEICIVQENRRQKL
jgi:hypothetical protein